MDQFLASLEVFGRAEGWVNLLTLIILETVLGIDNIIFISIIAGKLNKQDQRRAWNIGLVIAMLVRVVLLFFISFIMGMEKELFEVFGEGFSGRDLILFAGGVFLLVKTTSEIHNKMEGPREEDDSKSSKAKALFSQVILQIVLIDIVFSFDSILTAVGISKYLSVMVFAVIASTVIMMLFSRPVANFVERHPTVKMLALAFLLMIGMVLILDSLHVHVEKAYVYCSMAFAFLVELLNMRVRKKSGAKK
ncbi:MAG: TerC family protein [Bacteroidia bacterium]|jgi:predicted tellurium resistance membrane protein TerC|nr:TerC family protein [Bacteroidia bacterium]